MSISSHVSRLPQVHSRTKASIRIAVVSSLAAGLTLGVATSSFAAPGDGTAGAAAEGATMGAARSGGNSELRNARVKTNGSVANVRNDPTTQSQNVNHRYADGTSVRLSCELFADNRTWVKLASGEGYISKELIAGAGDLTECARPGPSAQPRAEPEYFEPTGPDLATLCPSGARSSFDCVRVFAAGGAARGSAVRNFGFEARREDGIGNAYQHAYWAALICASHPDLYHYILAQENRKNNKYPTAMMDFKNDEIGCEVGKSRQGGRPREVQVVLEEYLLRLAKDPRTPLVTLE